MLGDVGLAVEVALHDPRCPQVVGHAEHTAGLMRQATSTDTESEAVLTHFVGEMSETELARLQQVLARRSGGSPRRA